MCTSTGSMCDISGSVCNISGSERIYIRHYVHYLRQYVSQTMAMVESIWPSEQLATALTSTVDAQSLDPADPQVGVCLLMTGTQPLCMYSRQNITTP